MYSLFMRILSSHLFCRSLFVVRVVVRGLLFLFRLLRFFRLSRFFSLILLRLLSLVDGFLNVLFEGLRI